MKPAEIVISPNFTVDDIHNLRVQIGEQYRSMSHEEVERDIALRVQRVEADMEKLRKRDKTA
ncbi:MAG: hypothetical protein LBN20_01410 [Endomicrobium sp.]|jgi:hypothetical protein|nr:hypothetical protein [Endomicrobium sp.]